MANPPYVQIIYPLLSLLGKEQVEVESSRARELLGVAMNVSAADRQERLPSGQQPVFDNRVGWAQDRLKRAGLSESTRRGYWKITQSGRDWLRDHPNGPTPEELVSMSNGVKKTRPRLRSDPAAPAGPATGTPTTPPTTQSPQERIEVAIEELRFLLAEDLMERILDGSADFFERLVLDLLHAMGYGVSRADVQQVGGPGDGGIDGIIALDKLGLQKVYIQAKKWRDNTVGRKEIHSFYGALSERKATMGVFITTSTFTSDAKESARRFSDAIVLIDGRRLTGLMIDYGVGVSIEREVRLAKLDSDYFLEE